MVIENMLGGPLPEKYAHLETCSRVHGDEVVEEGSQSEHLVAKDYTHYLLFVVIYMLVLIVIYMFFFKTELRRTNAGLPRKIPKNLSFLRDPNKDVESLLPGVSPWLEQFHQGRDWSLTDVLLPLSKFLPVPYHRKVL